jgi:hypothetical protein
MDKKVAYDEEGNMLFFKDPDQRKYPVMWWSVPSKMETLPESHSFILKAKTEIAKPLHKEPEEHVQKESLINQYFKPSQGVVMTIFKTNSNEVLYQSESYKSDQKLTV